MHRLFEIPHGVDCLLSSVLGSFEPLSQVITFGLQLLALHVVCIRQLGETLIGVALFALQRFDLADRGITLRISLQVLQGRAQLLHECT